MTLYLANMHSSQICNHAARVPVNEFQQILQSRLQDVCHVFYENNVHKKFLADVYAVIPKGKKCVIWFTNKQTWMFQIAKRPYQPNQSQPNQSQPPRPHQVRPSQPVSFDSVRMLNAPCTDEAPGCYRGQHGACGVTEVIGNGCEPQRVEVDETKRREDGR